MSVFAMFATLLRGTERSERRSRRRETQKGFSLTELVITLTAVGAILTPVLNAVDSSMETIRADDSAGRWVTGRLRRWNG